jgi:hypothetical protein
MFLDKLCAVRNSRGILEDFLDGLACGRRHQCWVWAIYTSVRVAAISTLSIEFIRTFPPLDYRRLRFGLEPQIIVHRDLNILLGPQIAFRGLDRGVAEQEFDLLQIPAVLAAELGAGATEVVGAEVLDADLFR